MEWNKEEAVRAKGIAESKMEIKDFAAARRFALKAQRLCADLENISQMLMVCEVHCSADQKLFGNEMDWYHILQVEQTADEGTIKKQYRKFALQLHPDKNKFPGAEAAFKLIGEAQMLLLDKGKRSLLDIKRNASAHQGVPSYRSQQRASYSTNSGVQNNFRCNFTGVNLQDPWPQHSATGQGFSNGRPTFWTICPFCDVKHQYFIEFINRSLVCQNCKKSFVAYQSMQGAPTTSNFNQTAFPQRKDVSNQGDCKVKLRSHGNIYAQHSETGFNQKKGHRSEKVNGKRRRKQEEESSESFDDGSSSDSDVETPVDEDGDFNANVNVQCCGDRPRRSARNKQQVSYKENMSDEDDDELVGHSKKAKGSGASQLGTRNGLKDEPSDVKEPSIRAVDVNDQGEPKKKVNNGCQQNSFEANINSPANSDSKVASGSAIYTCPDPEFSDFDKERKEDCFSSGQIWALYDELDAMPRFYVHIRKVFSPGFKVRMTWLEVDAEDEDERDWVNEDIIPASCGQFKHGKTENTENRDQFSHLVHWEKGSHRNTYKILPRKGEIWALFKNWEVVRKSDDANQKTEYEFVEILSDYTEDIGVCVAYLDKLKGFVSIFCQTSEATLGRVQIPPDELFRFSHKVPSCRMTGEERDGVPGGSFELDPAALPTNICDVGCP